MSLKHIKVIGFDADDTLWVNEHEIIHDPDGTNDFVTMKRLSKLLNIL